MGPTTQSRVEFILRALSCELSDRKPEQALAARGADLLEVVGSDESAVAACYRYRIRPACELPAGCSLCLSLF